ncbi:MAG: glycosyltransferase family 39 protein [Bacteroidales bacterium]|nr:glycosyltransferase family 39 protein [Bacteroidales bacterium]
MYKNKKIEYIFIFLLYVFLFIHHFIGFGGHFGWDDMEYAHLSHQWANGTFHLSNNHFSYRLPIIIFTGFIYKYFGINEFSSALPALIISMIILFLVYLTLKQRDTRIVVTGLLLCTTVPAFLFYTDKIMADLYVALGILISFFALYLYRFNFKTNAILWASIFVTGLLFAFITKEVVVLVLPTLTILLISDIIKQRHLKFWAFSVILGILALLLYHVWIAYKTGNPFSRYLAIAYNAYLNPCSYEYLPFIYTLKRIGYELWFEFTLNGFMVLGAFLLPVFFYKRKWTFNKPESFWGLISITLLLSANFMTKNYSAYSPMCTDIRHYLFLVPILSVTTAPFIVRYFFSIRKSWFIVIFNGLMLLWLYFNLFKIPLKAIFVFYICIFVVFLIAKVLTHPRLKTTIWIIFLASWLIVPITQMYYDNKNGYNNIEPFFDKHFKKINTTAIVLTDPVMKRIADYQMHWDSSKVRFINERSPLIPYRHEAHEYYIYHNDLTWWLTGIKKGGSMIMWYYHKPNIKLIDSINGNVLYKVILPEKMNRPVSQYQFTNDMEWAYIPMFSCNNFYKDSTQVFNGKYSYKLVPQGFSPTLNIPMSHIISSMSSKIEIEIEVAIWAQNNNFTNLVMSIEDTTGKTIFWLGKPIKELIRSCNCWQKCKHNMSYEPKTETLKHHLKIYLWNNDSSTVWIDDLKLKIVNIEHL